MAENKPSEAEIATLVDKRIAELFGVTPEKLKEMKNAGGAEAAGQELMATPSVLSLVRATAYVHC